ncbi:hypothetical protein ACFE04_025258 [Oxalis oulophora]
MSFSNPSQSQSTAAAETLTLIGGVQDQTTNKVTAETTTTTTTTTAPIETDQVKEEEDEEEEEEEEGECGFCVFMKGGGCKEVFIAWEDCIEAAEKKEEDIVNKCFEATSALRKCMEAHEDYYAPILKVEKRAEEELLLENEREKAKENEALVIVDNESAPSAPASN